MNAATIESTGINKVKADASLDVRGVPCPFPPIKTISTLNKMQSGQVLEVLGPNPLAKRSAPMAAKLMGHELLSVENEKGGYCRFLVRKK